MPVVTSAPVTNQSRAIGRMPNRSAMHSLTFLSQHRHDRNFREHFSGHRWTPLLEYHGGSQIR
ncbi:hypothetical protein Lesp01_35600 [Lentzea sp. NBRC 102530]|nr:hypothetical protein Lesp01_35600 [Lentzea sp. NBRC 102530]